MEVDQGEGGEQGDAMMPLLFSLGTQPLKQCTDIARQNEGVEPGRRGARGVRFLWWWRMPECGEDATKQALRNKGSRFWGCHSPRFRQEPVAVRAGTPTVVV